MSKYSDKIISAVGWGGLPTRKNLRKGLLLRKEVQKRKNRPLANIKGGCILIVYYEEIITGNVSIFSAPLVEAEVGGV